MRQLLAQETLETLEPLEPLVVAQETSVSHWSRSLGDASCASTRSFQGRAIQRTCTATTVVGVRCFRPSAGMRPISWVHIG